MKKVPLDVDIHIHIDYDTGWDDNQTDAIFSLTVPKKGIDQEDLDLLNAKWKQLLYDSGGIADYIKVRGIYKTR